MRMGMKLKLCRTMLNLGQLDIANDMKTTKQTISNIESGKSEQKSAIEHYKIILAQRFKERGLVIDVNMFDKFDID